MSSKELNPGTDQISAALARLPLVLHILSELRSGDGLAAGDEELRHACGRAVTRMMAELARLDPSRVGKKSTARLLPARAEDLLDPDQMERLRSLLERFGRR